MAWMRQPSSEVAEEQLRDGRKARIARHHHHAHALRRGEHLARPRARRVLGHALRAKSVDRAQQRAGAGGEELRRSPRSAIGENGARNTEWKAMVPENIGEGIEAPWVASFCTSSAKAP